MKKIIFFIFLLTSIVSFGYGDDWIPFEKSNDKDWISFGKINDEDYNICFNFNGGIAKNTVTDEVIYLGKDKDAFSKKYGKGHWFMKGDEFYILFDNKTFVSKDINLKYEDYYSNETWSNKLVMSSEGFLLNNIKEGVWIEYNRYDKYYSDGFDYNVDTPPYSRVIFYENENIIKYCGYDLYTFQLLSYYSSKKDNNKPNFEMFNYEILKKNNPILGNDNRPYNGYYYVTDIYNLYYAKVIEIGKIINGKVMKKKSVNLTAFDTNFEDIPDMVEK